MKEKIGAYYHLNEGRSSYKLNYVIKNIQNGKVYVNVKKNVKANNLSIAHSYALYYISKNIFGLIKIGVIHEECTINFFVKDKSLIDDIVLSNDRETYDYIYYFLDKFSDYKIKEFKKIKGFIYREYKPSISLYIESQKASKEFKKLVKRNSTLKIMNEKISDAEELIFFDFEMNCLSDFKSVEIISVGAVKTDLYGNFISKFYSCIKPKGISTLTDKCLEITDLKQNDIDQAEDFNSVFDRFQEWVGEKNKIYYFWGGNDIAVLKNDYDRNNKVSDVINDILDNNIDFQEVLCKDILEIKDVLSLKNALNYYELEFNGVQHNALNDAHNLHRVYLQAKKNHNIF